MKGLALLKFLVWVSCRIEKNAASFVEAMDPDFRGT